MMATQQRRNGPTFSEASWKSTYKNGRQTATTRCSAITAMVRGHVYRKTLIRRSSIILGGSGDDKISMHISHSSVYSFILSPTLCIWPMCPSFVKRSESRNTVLSTSLVTMIVVIITNHLDDCGIPRHPISSRSTHQQITCERSVLHKMETPRVDMNIIVRIPSLHGGAGYGPRCRRLATDLSLTVMLFKAHWSVLSWSLAYRSHRILNECHARE